ncbi:MAG: hypothetical protein ACRC6X_05105 [Culicoidibacterales bacterium]
MKITFNKLSLFVTECEVIDMKIDLIEHTFQINIYSNVIDENIDLIFRNVTNIVNSGWTCSTSYDEDENENIYIELQSLLLCSVKKSAKNQYNVALELMTRNFLINSNRLDYKIGNKYKGVLSIESSLTREINKKNKKLGKFRSLFNIF